MGPPGLIPVGKCGAAGSTGKALVKAATTIMKATIEKIRGNIFDEQCGVSVIGLCMIVRVSYAVTYILTSCS